MEKRVHQFEQILGEKHTNYDSLILKTIPDLVFRLSRDGVHLSFHSPSLDKLFLNPNEFLGRNVKDVLPEDVSEKYIFHIHKAIENNNIQSFIYKLNFSLQDTRYYEARLNPISEEEVLVIVREVTDQIKSERTQRRHQRMLARTEKIAHVGSWEWDIKTDSVIWSEEMYSIFQLDPDSEAPTWAEHPKLYHPKDFEKLRQAKETAISDGNPYELELRAFRKDGATRICIAKGFPETGEDGKVVRLFGLLQDITEMKIAEKKLKESEEKYRLIAENMGDIITTLDMELNITYVSPSIKKLRGFTVEESIAQQIDEIMTPESFQRLSEAVADEIKLEQAGTADPDRVRIIELEEYKNDGSTIWVENTASFIRDKDKKPSGILVISRDITERKQTENALRKSEERFSLAMEASKDGIWDWDLTTGEIYCSPSLTSMLGYNSNDFIESVDQWQELIHPDDRQKAYQSNFDCVHNLTDSFEVEYRMLTQDGGWKWIVGRGKAVQRDASGKALRIIGTHRDNTDHKRAVAEKETLQAQLHQSQKMESVGRLAGGVAHDFNNMLGVILGHTELALLQADENHDLYGDLKEIQKAAQRSASITKQLLAFARKQTISPRQLDLNDTLESMLNMLRRLIGEDIELIWQPASDLWPVKMDPSQIDQILANLCINARDAISGVGKLTIETGKYNFDKEYCIEHPEYIPGDFVLLGVSDNGCGMDKETLDNLFEPFFTTKEVGKGTGLGLATIYGIVKQNNGFINVYSEPGRGSTFKIYLPRLVAVEDAEKAVPEKKPADSGTETILLVEDEPTILRMTRMMLERKGYTVLTAATPSEAIEEATNYSGSIDLLMTDVVMPEMNGRDLAAKVTVLHPDIRLLFMSGYTADVIAHQGILDDGVVFIQKPFSLAEMTEKVRNVLDKASDETQ